MFAATTKLPRALYEKAAQAAERTTETDKKLIAKLNLAKLGIQEGRGAKQSPPCVRSRKRLRLSV